jgi:hypothetical protein
VVAPIAHPVKVSGLLGPWTVAPARGKADKIQVGVGAASMQGPCGELAAAWVATVDGQFNAALSYGSMCGEGAGATMPQLPAWLTDATRVRTDAEGWALIDARGAVTARLAPDPATTMPMITEDQVAQLDRQLPPLPAGKRPVTAAQLVGTWVPKSLGSGVDGVPGHTRVTFGPKGRAENSGLTWLVDPLGRVVVAHGPSTMICATLPGEPGCVSVPAWFDDTTVAYEQGQLVLYDESGRAVHILVRR